MHLLAHLNKHSEEIRMHDRHDLVNIVQSGYLIDFSSRVVRFVDIDGDFELYSFDQLQTGIVLIQSMLHSINEYVLH